MEIKERNLFSDAVNNYLQGGLGTMQVYGPSQGLEADFHSAKYRSTLVATSPVDAMYGFAIALNKVDELIMGNLVNEGGRIAEGVVVGWTIQQWDPEKVEESFKKQHPLIRPLYRRLFKILTPDVSKGLEEFYNWVLNTNDKFHPFKFYLAIGWLRTLEEDYGVQLDGDVSSELRRVRDRFPSERWPDFKKPAF